MQQRLAMLVAAAGIVMAVACAQTDPGITTAVKAKFAADDTVKAYQINVDTSNHVVTLKGNVDSAAAKERAVAIARQTDGVTNVVDQINVGAAPAATSGEIKDDAREIGRDAKETVGNAADRAGEAISDAAITTAVKSKFLADTSTPGLKIDVDTKDGIVTLNGTVRSKAEVDRAMTLARETNGVKRVVSNLRIQA
jgi:hyperosmotically inducible periplasmic protein